jgi:hypothetical protein
MAATVLLVVYAMHAPHCLLPLISAARQWMLMVCGNWFGRLIDCFARAATANWVCCNILSNILTHAPALT